MTHIGPTPAIASVDDAPSMSTMIASSSDGRAAGICGRPEPDRAVLSEIKHGLHQTSRRAISGVRSAIERSMAPQIRCLRGIISHGSTRRVTIPFVGPPASNGECRVQISARCRSRSVLVRPPRRRFRPGRNFATGREDGARQLLPQERPQGIGRSPSCKGTDGRREIALAQCLRRVGNGDGSVHQGARVAIAPHHAVVARLAHVRDTIQIKDRSHRFGPRLAAPDIQIRANVSAPR